MLEIHTEYIFLSLHFPAPNGAFHIVGTQKYLLIKNWLISIEPSKSVSLLKQMMEIYKI